MPKPKVASCYANYLQLTWWRTCHIQLHFSRRHRRFSRALFRLDPRLGNGRQEMVFDWDFSLILFSSKLFFLLAFEMCTEWKAGVSYHTLHASSLTTFKARVGSNKRFWQFEEMFHELRQGVCNKVKTLITRLLPTAVVIINCNSKPKGFPLYNFDTSGSVYKRTPTSSLWATLFPPCSKCGTVQRNQE